MSELILGKVHAIGHGNRDDEARSQEMRARIHCSLELSPIPDKFDRRFPCLALHEVPCYAAAQQSEQT
eukprot:g75483.t1